MIDKKLNKIRDRIHLKDKSDEDLFLTKGETKYLLRLLEIAQDNLHLQSKPEVTNEYGEVKTK